MRVRTMLEPTAWHDVEPRVRGSIQSAGAADAGSVRFLVSAHAATEELFVLKQMVEGLLGIDGLSAVTLSWNHREKPQPAGAVFRISATDAPNVNGARDLGFAVGLGNDGPADLSGLRTDVEGGRVKALYVVDPGPDGSIGDVSWVVAARRSGKLPLLIVQGVVMTDLAEAADIVLPGAAWVEKDAIYTNDQGRVQAASQAIAPPGEAREDWQILAGSGAIARSHHALPELERRSCWRSPRPCQGRSTPMRRRWLSRARCRPAIGSRPRTRQSGGSGISCIRTCRP